MKKEDLIEAILDLQEPSGEDTEAQLRKLKVADLQAILDDLTDEQDEQEETGNRVLKKYRDKYVEMAKETGHKATTCEGKATLNNGDQLALLWEYASPEQVAQLADTLLDKPVGTHLATYTADRVGQPHPKTGQRMKALNPGMVRMNTGNKVRSWAKQHEDGIELILAALTKMGVVTKAV